MGESLPPLLWFLVLLTGIALLAFAIRRAAKTLAVIAGVAVLSVLAVGGLLASITANTASIAQSAAMTTANLTTLTLVLMLGFALSLVLFLASVVAVIAFWFYARSRGWLGKGMWAKAMQSTTPQAPALPAPTRTRRSKVVVAPPSQVEVYEVSMPDVMGDDVWRF